LPRWILQALIVAALILGGIGYINITRVRIPEACRDAERALGAADYDLAIDEFLLCLDEGELPDDILARVYYALGNAYTAKGDYRQSVKDYSEVINLEPNHAWAYNNRCWSYALLRRGEVALQDCQQALRLLPDQPEILDSRALAYWVVGDLDRARLDLERANRLGSSFPTAEERLREFEGLF